VLLDNLNLAKSYLPSIGYDLKIALTITKDNFNELGQFVNFCRPYVKNLSNDLSMSFMNSLAPKNDYFNVANVIPEKTYINTHCHMVAAALPYTLVDGRISVCCRDYDGSLVVGDISASNPIDRILEEKPYKNLLDFQEGKTASLNNGPEYELCKTCFIVDDRIQTVWDQSVAYILHKIPNKDEFILQGIFNELLQCLKVSDVTRYSKLMVNLK
jgi:hypothetical protein